MEGGDLLSFLGKKLGEEVGGGGGGGGFWGTFMLEFVKKAPYFFSGMEGGVEGMGLEGGEWEGGVKRVARMKEMRGVFTKMLGMLCDGEGGGGAGLLEVEAKEVGRHLTCWEFLLQKNLLVTDVLRFFSLFVFSFCFLFLFSLLFLFPLFFFFFKFIFNLIFSFSFLLSFFPLFFRGVKQRTQNMTNYMNHCANVTQWVANQIIG